MKGSSSLLRAPVITNMSSSADSCEFLCALAATDGSSSGDLLGSSSDWLRDSTLLLYGDPESLLLIDLILIDLLCMIFAFYQLSRIFSQINLELRGDLALS